MKKVIVIGPVLSRSGYGEMARNAVKALIAKPGLFDLYIQETPWGSNANILNKENQDFNLMNFFINKTNQVASQNNGALPIDISIQVSLPTDWKKIAPINIGYTAGIETNFISPAWLQPSLQMDKIIVISEHAKSGFVDTEFGDQQDNKYKVTTPIDVVHFPVKNYDHVDLNLDLDYDFNFLAVCQWGPRKNLEQTIINFIEEFRNEEVGLVIKTNRASDSIMDREDCSRQLNLLLSNYKDRKCKIHLLHGAMSEQELHSLYKHPKIKAIVSSTHGEGYGLPLFEASYSELPIIATDWSGHLDFLSVEDKKMFAKVDFELKPIAQEHVWQGVLEAGTSWAYPLQNSLKSKMREVYKDYTRFKSWAKKLSIHNREKFTEEKIYNNFLNSLGLFFKPEIIEPKQINGLSFCIPTHGKRVKKTLKTIDSIKKQNWNNIPYEIIIAGDVDSFVGLENVTLVNLKEDAHNRKAAKLRNSAADLSKYDNIVFCDDDMLLNNDWLEKTLEYSKTNGWNVLGNIILNPDGTRHWDKTILNPRKLVPYNHSVLDKNLMVTSNFFIIRKNLFVKNRWDETKLSYADRLNEGIPEDVKFHLDLRDNNIILSFNENSIVWHNDESYSYVKIGDLEQTLNKETILKLVPSFQFPENHPRFLKLLGE